MTTGNEQAPPSSEAAEGWDRGLQNERTSLAWSRTILSCLGCALVLARFAARLHWTFAIGLAGLALAFAATAAWASSRRYRTAASALSAGHHLPDGNLPAITLAFLQFISLAAVLLIV